MSKLMITSALVGAITCTGSLYAQSQSQTEPVDPALFAPEDPALVITLNVTGSCPGSMKVCINGAVPGDFCGIVRSFTLGVFNVPGCGPIGGLNSPAIVSSGTADSFGMFCVGGNVPPSACGFLFVQGVDQTMCLVTGVVTI